MNSQGSVINTILNRVRSYCENPDIDAKYDDDYILRNAVYPAFADLMARLTLSGDNPILSRFDFTIDATQPFYQLPTCVSQVWGLGTMDDLNRLSFEYKPTRTFHWGGAGWWLEGNQVMVDLSIITSTELTLLYISNGDALFHYATTGNLSMHDGVSRFQITPDNLSGIVGGVDRRENAYLGQYLRLLSSTGVWEERVIAKAWEDHGLFFVETRTPFTKKLVGANLTYEVVPCTGSQAWIDAIALSAAVIAAVWRREGEGHQRQLNYRYRIAIKTLKDTTANMQIRVPKSYQKDTFDNPDSFWSPGGAF